MIVVMQSEATEDQVQGVTVAPSVGEVTGGVDIEALFKFFHAQTTNSIASGQHSNVTWGDPSSPTITEAVIAVSTIGPSVALLGASELTMKSHCSALFRAGIIGDGSRGQTGSSSCIFASTDQ